MHQRNEPVNPVANNVNGMEYWRSLEQLADSPAMREMISKEFPGYDAEGMLNTTRRKFLKLMGASLALAGLSLNGCRRWPVEKLAPYSSNPRERIPGVPEQYATALEIGGVASGLLVTSFDGRPIKIEGNPSHPYAWTIKDKIGSADLIAQASVLEMYDPNRSGMVVDRTATRAERAEGDTPTGIVSTWDAFTAFATTHFTAMNGSGAGFAILSEATSSPTAIALKKGLLAAYPKAKWYEYEAVSGDSEVEASTAAFGKPVRTVLHLDKASTVLLLDADLLGAHPAHTRYAADWAQRRRWASEDPKSREMNRVYLAETGFSITGSVADYRLPIDPSRMYVIARAIAAKVGVAGLVGEDVLVSDDEKFFVEAAVADLKAAGKNAVVAAGPMAPVQAQVLAHAINEKLGVVGTTVTLLEDPTAIDRPSHVQAITALAAEMKAGKVSTLLVLGGNPAYDAPADLAFGELLAKVPMSIRLGLYDDETSHLCKWHLPRAHYLESWGDARAWDGTAGIVQPLILPLYNGKSVIELLAFILNEAGAPTAGDQLVRRTWVTLKYVKPGADGDQAFRRVVEAGLLPGSGYKPASVTVNATTFAAAPKRVDGMYLRFVPDTRVYDGRFANNGWLQEVPESLTKMVWDNAVLVSKQDADRLKAVTGDLIRIKTAAGIEQEIALYVMPGQPVGVVTLPLGFGRTHAGPVGTGIGFNAFALRDSKSPLIAAGAVLGLTGNFYKLVSTQDHHIMDKIGANAREKRVGEKGESGKIIHETTFAEYRKDPRAAHGGPRSIPLQLFEPPSQFNEGHAWGMAVDLNTCIGCNACVVACQAENNIPIVGKDEASNHRSMHWIRIDRYFKGAAEEPDIEVAYQPMLCQHCENAPCEQVCPVAATMHDNEGLNTMVYNRCIGTRYCSNNCPYKVRRFNYFDYHSKDPRAAAVSYLKLPDMQQLETIDKVKQMVFNPDVTIRMRGVMEKCTFCVQRIHGTVIQKRNIGKDVEDRDIVTACEQACPTQAIVFGDLNDAKSRVRKLHENARSWGVLHEELDTRPRVKYQAKLRNPPELVSAAESGHGEGHSPAEHAG